MSRFDKLRHHFSATMQEVNHASIQVYPQKRKNHVVCQFLLHRLDREKETHL